MLADQPFLSIPEAAVAFDVSESSVRRWVKDGRLKSTRLPSGRRRIRRTDVEAFLSEDAAEAGAA
jgi:excisionase family DNA binding protein